MYCTVLKKISWPYIKKNLVSIFFQAKLILWFDCTCIIHNLCHAINGDKREQVAARYPTVQSSKLFKEQSCEVSQLI